MTEKQIEEIKRYLLDQSYNYAILSDGEWWSGKIFFACGKLTDAIENMERNLDNPRKVKYISFYG